MMDDEVEESTSVTPTGSERKENYNNDDNENEETVSDKNGTCTITDAAKKLSQEELDRIAKQRASSRRVVAATYLPNRAVSSSSLSTGVGVGAGAGVGPTKLQTDEEKKAAVIKRNMTNVSQRLQEPEQYNSVKAPLSSLEEVVEGDVKRNNGNDKDQQQQQSNHHQYDDAVVEATAVAAAPTTVLAPQISVGGPTNIEPEMESLPTLKGGGNGTDCNRDKNENVDGVDDKNGTSRTSELTSRHFRRGHRSSLARNVAPTTPPAVTSVPPIHSREEKIFAATPGSSTICNVTAPDHVQGYEDRINLKLANENATKGTSSYAARRNQPVTSHATVAPAAAATVATPAQVQGYEHKLSEKLARENAANSRNVSTTINSVGGISIADVAPPPSSSNRRLGSSGICNSNTSGNGIATLQLAAVRQSSNNAMSGMTPSVAPMPHGKSTGPSLQLAPARYAEDEARRNDAAIAGATAGLDINRPGAYHGNGTNFAHARDIEATGEGDDHVGDITEDGHAVSAEFQPQTEIVGSVLLAYVHSSNRNLDPTSEVLEAAVVGKGEDADAVNTSKRRILIVSIVGLVIIVAVVVAVILVSGSESRSTTMAGPSDTPVSTATPTENTTAAPSEAPFNIDDYAVDEVIASVPTLLCKDNYPGSGYSENCDPSETTPHGGTANNLIPHIFHQFGPAADIVIVNAGALAMDILAGDFRFFDASLLLPFRAPLITADLTGTQIMTLIHTALSQALLGTEEGCSCVYPYASGLRFDVDGTVNGTVTGPINGTESVGDLSNIATNFEVKLDGQ